MLEKPRTTILVIGSGNPLLMGDHTLEEAQVIIVAGEIPQTQIFTINYLLSHHTDVNRLVEALRVERIREEHTRAVPPFGKKGPTYYHDHRRQANRHTQIVMARQKAARRQFSSRVY